MSETDFSREHAERAEAQRFELEKMRERAALNQRAARRLLVEVIRQRAFQLVLSADSFARAIISGNRRRR
jgi:hypothetical protein